MCLPRAHCSPALHLHFLSCLRCMNCNALNPVQCPGFIILTDMLRVALTRICYTAMTARNKLPGSTEHPSLTPSEPRQGQNSKYVPVKPPTCSTCSANKIPFYILHQKHFSSCPVLLLLLLFVVDHYVQHTHLSLLQAIA